MDIQTDPIALKTITSLHRPYNPDLLNQIVELFESESRRSIAALQQALDSPDLKARTAKLTLLVSTPA